MAVSLHEAYQFIIIVQPAGQLSPRTLATRTGNWQSLARPSAHCLQGYYLFSLILHWISLYLPNHVNAKQAKILEQNKTEVTSVKLKLRICD